MTVRDRAQGDRLGDALRASEERFRLLVEGVRDYAIFLLDAGGRISSWNPGAERIKGWTDQEILGQPYEVFFTAEDRVAGVPGRLLETARNQGSHEVYGWRVRKDGTRFWANALITALRGPDGELRGFAKITRDLTERMRAEENERRLFAERAAREAAEAAEHRVRQSEARERRQREQLDVILQGVAEGIMVQDRTARVIYANDAAARLYGCASARELVDSPPADVTERLEVLDEAGEPFPAERFPSRRVLTGAASAQETLRLRDPASGSGWVSLVNATPIFDAAGNVDLAVTIAHDITDQFNAQEALREADRRKDEFLAILGHELRNPLSPITTAVQLMKLREPSRLVREREVIERQVLHMSRLVEDLLDVSRIASGKVELHRRPLEAADLVHKAIETVSPLLEQHHHQLAVSVPRSGLRLSGDPVRLAQVLANLLNNAAKYTPRGGHISIGAAREGAEVVLRVGDDGMGIAKEMLTRVFEMFVQSPRTLDRSVGGLGLGLAVVKSLVALHGGTVSAFSNGLNQGSEFVVRLPALLDAEGAEDRPPPVPALASSPTRRVLLVDDNADAADLLADALRLRGHDVLVCRDAPEALAVADDTRFEIGILDLGLPGMDGYELARRIRASWRGPPLRLIAVTGYGQEHDRVRSKEAGFDDHLVKPAPLDRIFELVEEDAR